jgi:hypothetical protein
MVADRNSRRDGGSDSHMSVSSDGYVSSETRARRDMGEVANATLVLDDRAGIDNGVPLDGRIRVHNSHRQDHRPVAHRDAVREKCCGMNDRDEPQASRLNTGGRFLTGDSIADRDHDATRTGSGFRQHRTIAEHFDAEDPLAAPGGIVIKDADHAQARLAQRRVQHHESVAAGSVDENASLFRHHLSPRRADRQIRL